MKRLLLILATVTILGKLGASQSYHRVPSSFKDGVKWQLTGEVYGGTQTRSRFGNVVTGYEKGPAGTSVYRKGPVVDATIYKKVPLGPIPYHGQPQYAGQRVRPPLPNAIGGYTYGTPLHPPYYTGRY